MAENEADTSTTTLEDQFRDMLSQLAPEQVLDLQRDFALAAVKAEREAVPEHERGTPKDPAVQAAAAHWFRLMRRPEERKRLARILGDEVVPYERMGDLLGKTSRERIRQLYEKLCPLEYETERQERKTNTRALRIG